jgi:FkbM family methyltransferase
MEDLISKRGALHFAVRDQGDRFVISEVVDHDAYNLAGDGGLVDRFAGIERPLTIVDIGANIGAFTCFARTAWPDAYIRAVESNAENFRLLTMNVESNSDYFAAQTDLLWAAIWDGSTDRAYTVGHGGLAGTVATEPTDGVEVDQIEAVTLDVLLDDLDRVDILKIDTEGAEVPIVLGASPETLGKVAYVTGEFHGMDPRWGEWARKLAGFFELTLRAHPYPDHIWGGMFNGAAR